MQKNRSRMLRKTGSHIQIKDSHRKGGGGELEEASEPLASAVSWGSAGA